MNLHVIAGPAGQPLWVSGALPGSVHDMKAAWIWGIEDELAAAGLVTLADKGYQGAAHVRFPYRGKNKPDSQKEANRAHAKLRAPEKGSYSASVGALFLFGGRWLAWPAGVRFAGSDTSAWVVDWGAGMVMITGCARCARCSLCGGAGCAAGCRAGGAAG